MAKNPLSHCIGWCDYELSLKPKQKPKSFFLPCNTYMGLKDLGKAHTIVNITLPIPLKPLEFNYFSVMKTSMVLEANPTRHWCKSRGSSEMPGPLADPYGEKPAFHSLPLGRWEWATSVLGRRERAIPQFLILNFTFLLPSERWFGIGSNFHLQYTQHFERE